MKVWITKFALTKGILEMHSDDTRSDEHMIYVPDPGYLGQHFHGEGREWHRTREAAVARAEEMRLAKIDLLAKQIEKLRKLTF